MIVLIDTNVLLMALPSKSLYHLIIKKFNDRKYSLVITTEIYLEYEEILKVKANKIIAANILNAFIEAPNVMFIDLYYQWDFNTG